MKKRLGFILCVIVLMLCIRTRVLAKYIMNDKVKITDIDVKRTYSITVKYIDSKSNSILESETNNNLKEGDSYNCNPIEIEGYYLDGDSENTSGIIESENIEVDYYYRPVGVFAKCFDTSGDGRIDTLVLNNNPYFTYDGILKNEFENQDNNDYQQNSNNNIPIWHDVLEQIVEVVILNNIHPLNYTARWFEYGKNIEIIDGIDNISTNEVKDMARMFKNCEKMKNIDISNLNTSNVENMKGLFYRCYQLENINVSGLNTSKVTNMDIMFTDCEKLSQIDLSDFDTRNVTRMESMFCNCTSLTNIIITSFNTSKVTTMVDMFSACNKLKKLDISNFDTQNVTNMYGMFYRCSELKTIYIGKKWNTNRVSNSSIMFSGDYKLEGGKGTIYNGYFVDKTYAHNDEGKINPGYLTIRETKSLDKSNTKEDEEESNSKTIINIDSGTTDNETIIENIETNNIEQNLINTIIQPNNNYINNNMDNNNIVTNDSIYTNINNDINQNTIINN